MKYSYDLYSKLGRIQGGPINEKHYNKIIKKYHPTKEWETKYKDSTLYGKQYKINGYLLFMWKEVFQ